MEKETYNQLKNKLVRYGYGVEIKYIEKVLSKPCNNQEQFLNEYVWVVINSGMKNQVAERIFNRVINAWKIGKKTEDVFKHKGKAISIEFMRKNVSQIFSDYQNSNKKLLFIEIK